MNAKQDHCTPICAMPSNPAKHSNPLTVLQHATSALEPGSRSILPRAEVLDVAPRRMKPAEMPSGVRKEMIL